MPYFDYLPKSVATWLQGPNGQKFMETLGLSLDQMAELWRIAVRQRFPYFAASDALEALGSERQIDRGGDEDFDHYRPRVHAAWDTWSFAGSAGSMLRTLRDIGYPNVAIVQQNGIGYQVLADVLTITALGTDPTFFNLPWWTFDLNRPLWSRFAVLFYPPFDGEWMISGTHPNATVTMDPGEIDIIRAVVQKWKPGNMTCLGIEILTDGQCIGWPVRQIGNGTTIVPAGSTHGGAVVHFDP